MPAPSIGDSLTSGVDFLKKNPIPAIVGVLLVSLVGSFTGGILYGVMLVGYLEMIKMHRAGSAPEIADVFSGFQKLVPALLAGILGMIMVSIGTMLCIIPGLLAAPVMWAALYFVANGEQDGVNALKRGWATIKPHLVMAAVTVLVLGIVGGLGAIACGIGALVTAPIAVAGIYHYVEGLVGGEGVAAAAASPSGDEGAADAEEDEPKDV
jgi:uncharacterized membrane protein